MPDPIEDLEDYRLVILKVGAQGDVTLEADSFCAWEKTTHPNGSV